MSPIQNNPNKVQYRVDREKKRFYYITLYFYTNY